MSAGHLVGGQGSVGALGSDLALLHLEVDADQEDHLALLLLLLLLLLLVALLLHVLVAALRVRVGVGIGIGMGCRSSLDVGTVGEERAAHAEPVADGEAADADGREE